MDDQHPRRVEDYTTVSLVMILVNLLWIFGVIWAQFGLLVVILTGWGFNQRDRPVGTISRQPRNSVAFRRLEITFAASVTPPARCGMSSAPSPASTAPKSPRISYVRADMAHMPETEESIAFRIVL